MAVTAELVKALRERTGAGVMDCKAALSACQGDLERAVERLRKQGLAAAKRREGRKASEGLIVAHVAPAAERGALLELNCETDFVARTPEFGRLAAALAEEACRTGRVDAAARVAEASGAIGEHLVLRRYAVFAVDPAAGPGRVTAYVHGVGKVGVLLEVGWAGAAAAEGVAGLAKELALQVAAMDPRWVRREEVPAEVLEGERAILRAQPDLQGKPPAVQAKIIEGRLGKFFAEACLLDQPYIKDEQRRTTAGQMIRAAAARLGVEVTVRRFCRYRLGDAAQGA
jgi:elongation factor Ts